MAVAGVAAVGLGVAVVEAAAAVIMCSVEDGVHTLRPIADSCAADGVVAVSCAGRHEDTVGLLAVQCNGSTNCAGQVVIAICLGAVEASGGSLGEVVIAAGLVVNDGDKTGCAGAEGVLGGGVGDTTGGQGPDVGRGTVRATLHLVQRAAVATVEGTGGTVCGDTGRAAGGVDVAGPRGDEGACANKAESNGSREHG